ncbi:MAG: hypothetical protein ACLQF0_05540 [Dissulfurispiraceae bacterium]
MPASSLKIKTTPMEAGWKHRLHKRNQDVFQQSPQLLPLRDKLLSTAGEEVCFPVIEEDLPLLLSRGEFFSGKSSILKKGAPCQCHSNSAHLWDANRKRLALCTGYALSKDGLWRQHSFCVFKGAGGSVVETTVKRLLYFGYRFNEQEAEAFLKLNC